MTIDHAKLRALCEAARDGEWQLGIAGNCNVVSFDGDDIVGVAVVPNERNAALIVAAHQAVPELLDECERLREALLGAKSTLADIVAGLDAALSAVDGKEGE